MGTAAVLTGSGLSDRDGVLAAGCAVPGRDAMAPPDLARDAPVTDVFQPMGIDLGPALRMKFHSTRLILLQCPIGKRLHRHEPLLGDHRLDRSVATIAMAHRMHDLGAAEQHAGGFEFLEQGLARGEALHAGELRTVLGHGAVEIDDADQR